MEKAKRYSIDKDKISYRVIDSEAVILNLDNGQYYSLNRIGTQIWEAINKQKDIGEILNLLKTQYHLPEKHLKRDILKLVEDLIKEKLIIQGGKL